MPTIKDKLAKRVRFLRKERQWTQEQLGEKAGLTYKFVGQIERGEVSPTLDSLDKLAKAFGVTAGELLSFEKKGVGRTKEGIFQELSKGDLESIKKALEVLGRVFH
jgi:transcriptional regulator with XRE-family HTH domain